MRSAGRIGALAVAAAVLGACGAGLRPFPDRPVRWADDDRRPFGPRPPDQADMSLWDAAEGVFFRPLERGLSVVHNLPAVDVNAMDEVPDSSWFENRLGRHDVSPERFALGACEPGWAPVPPLVVVEAKPNGMQRGFVVRDAEGQRWLVKTDGEGQGPRATSADVVGAALFHAVGYHVPCNVIAWVDPDALRVDRRDEDAPSDEHVRLVLESAGRRDDGRLRFAASRFFDHRPVGPWRYHGRWERDPNDLVDHADRRELRGMRLFSAWIDHLDVRAQNTLGLWVETGEDRGYVRHALVDFGDALGARSEDERQDRRMRHQTWFDPTASFEDLVTLGLLPRPWYRPSIHGRTFASLRDFRPGHWVPHYWNGAFERMDEEDAAWAARILARVRPAHLEALIRRAELEDPGDRRRLLRGLLQRRRQLLGRYMIRRSPLTEPRLTADGLCLEDRAVSGGLRDVREARATLDGAELPVTRDGAEVCVRWRPTPGYHVLRVRTWTPGVDRPPSLRVHVRVDARGARIAGLER